ncbi:relaxase/mobilization nuclease domain-containing protein [Calothrix sp. FACHB-1219]|uniref:relaxase/mobilization nuclease domain-containing protein n=1 Tax=unclassified Calothrix TaxID=2619626 RepID=UPI00168939B0|nr:MULTISPECIES: relaxase/mobilization nuclease domain-containing protein [unclassified Calothrix]MBD2207472.1 relaxase/mobilization nuclease domain-containing protein [Calothrix sp. FACHB-168]MBD2222024.1 relaxase/mobilization nuclease domain-containing protein [Calothrix sp. FACHB-1219]
MIGKQTKGRGFRKLLDYLESSENAKLIGGNMSGRNSRELAKEFRLSRQLNPDAERVVYHVSLSAAKDDIISEDKWCEIGNRYMKEMGFDANQFVIFRHQNTDDDHVHIAASRIRMDTSLLVDDSWDYVRSEKVLRQIEIDYELAQVQGSRERLNRTQSTGQFRRIKREQEEYAEGKRDTPPQPSIKQLVQQTIDNASVDNPQMPELIMRLQQSGISVRTGFTRNGKSKGISYEKDGIAFSGTQLGAAYTFPGLQKHRGVDYQPKRDDAQIEQLLNNPVGRTVLSQQPINAIAQNKAQPLTTDKPKLKENSSAELYKYYSTELQNLLVTDRDKEIANRALLDNRPVEEVEEIILASPARWTTEEAKALVLIANKQLASNKEQKQSLPQFTPPAEDEKLWPALKNYLTQQRGISSNLVETLHLKGLGYIDQQRNVVFIKRDLNGSKSGALVWDTPRQDDRCSQKSENTQSRQSWFHINLGRETDDKIERVFLCDSPIDALTLAHMDMDAHKGLPPVKTMYLVVDDPDNLPLEFLKNISRIGLAFIKDDQGKETAKTVLKLLPQSKQLPPNNHSWNEDLLEILHIEQQKRRQQQRGFSR